jgi:hypothetical protein
MLSFPVNRGVCNHRSMGRVIAGSFFFDVKDTFCSHHQCSVQASCVMFWLLNLVDHEHKLLGYKLSIRHIPVKWLVLARFYILLLCAISHQFGQCCISNFPLEIILLNCSRYVFVLFGSWHCQNWHSNIHRRDTGFRRIHEIIFSTIDKTKLLAEVRLRTPIHVLCGFCLGFRWMTFHIT